MKVQQLESTHSRRSKNRLNLLFVARRLELAAGHQKIVGLIKHTMLIQRLAENLVIFRFQEASIFIHISEVRKSAPLPRLVRDDGVVVALQ